MAKKDNPSKGDDHLFFGKYKTEEEATKGFRETVGEMQAANRRAQEATRELEIQKAQNAALQAALDAKGAANPPAPQDVAITTEDGHLDVGKLLSAIDNRIAEQNAPLVQAMEKVPEMINQGIQGFTQPLLEIEAGKKDFFSRADVDAGFTEAKMNEILKQNASIKTAHERLLVDPETRDKAYEFVYDVWRNSEKGRPAKSAVEDTMKQSADEPDRGGGPPAESGEIESRFEHMHKASRFAQDMGSPDAALEFARQWIKGSKLESHVKQKPDWADETQEEGIDEG